MPDFIKAAKAQDIPPGTGRTVEVGGKKIALFNVGGKFEALADACAHRGGPLGEGALEGNCVVCPWHHWEYDVTSGGSTKPPGQHVAKYPTKLEGEDVLVEL
jgi:nitrite reductase/ring-hydroxylating ferredoxin subunit